jgi:hypothetical protein
MKRWEALTGADVLRMRGELKLARDKLHPMCQFPNSKSAARLTNIELKDSWKEGDKELVARALTSVYLARGLPLPEILSDGEWDGVLPQPAAEVNDNSQFVPDPRTVPASVNQGCSHPGGFMRRVDPQGNEIWVCENCGEESPHAAEARLARQTMLAGQPQDGEQKNSFPADVDALNPDEDWEELLASFVEVDTSDVQEPDYQITNSENRAWKRCHRKWWLEFYRKLGARAINFTSARATGDRVHRALAATYSGDNKIRVNPCDALERVIVEDWTEITKVVTDPTELAIVSERFAAANALERAMIEGYVEWLGESGADADYEVVGSEQVLSALFDIEVDGKTYLVELLGKLDARLRRKTDGAILFIDHKTVGSLTDIVPSLRQNEQMLTYVLLEALNAADDEYVSGALYNMLRKVKRTAQAKPPFFDRLEVHHNPIEIESFHVHLHGATRDIIRARNALDAGESHHSVAYPNPTNDCRYDCEFVRVCPLFDDGSPGVEDMLAAVYVPVNPLARYDGITPERSTVDNRENVK